MSDLCVLILVPNAEVTLRRCLESVTFADDIYCIVDTKSVDGSMDIAKEFTEHIAVREYVGAADQRNWGLEQVESQWTLILDADEWVSAELAEKIQAVVREGGARDYYRIRRRSYFFGTLILHCGWNHDYNLRLFRTKIGRFEKRRVHPSLVTDGPIGALREPMYHDTYRSFEQYFTTMQRFTTWGALDAWDNGRRASMFTIVGHPLFRFFKMYFFRLGFLDGYHGLVLCGLSAFSVFTKYGKLWNLGRIHREDEVQAKQ